MKKIPTACARAFSIALLMALISPVNARAQGNDDGLSSCSSQAISSRFIEFGRTGKMPPELGKWLRDPQGQYIEPYQAFDNVHYVGVCWVSAWIVKTSDGPVLIDTLHEPFVDQLVKNIRQVGVDPADIKLVLMTHGHFDHAGGAYKLKPLMPQAKFVMSRQGWQEAFEDVARLKDSPRAWRFLGDADTTARDGDVFQVGDTAFAVYETPGHTMGTVSYGFTVRDGEKSYNAFTVGGLGLNAIKNSAQVEAYIGSVEKISRLARAEKAPIEVHLTTHAFSTGLTEAARTLPTRKAGEPHPLVDQKSFLAQLDGLGKRAQERLVIEKQKESKQ